LIYRAGEIFGGIKEKKQGWARRERKKRENPSLAESKYT
jgi:hypothetical protein